MSTIVRQALCGVARVHGRFGIGAAARLLGGADDLRLQRAGLHNTSTFGVLSERAEEWILTLLRRCVTAGWVDFQGGDRPVVVVTDEGYDVIHERRPARLLLPPAASERGPRATARSGARRQAPPLELEESAGELFEALRAWRLETAREAGVPPYVVASDRSLRDIAALRPADSEALQTAHGIGPAKVEKYGDGDPGHRPGRRGRSCPGGGRLAPTPGGPGPGRGRAGRSAPPRAPAGCRRRSSGPGGTPGWSWAARPRP